MKKMCKFSDRNVTILAFFPIVLICKAPFSMAVETSCSDLSRPGRTGSATRALEMFQRKLKFSTEIGKNYWKLLVDCYATIPDPRSRILGSIFNDSSELKIEKFKFTSFIQASPWSVDDREVKLKSFGHDTSYDTNRW